MVPHGGQFHRVLSHDARPSWSTVMAVLRGWCLSTHVGRASILSRRSTPIALHCRARRDRLHFDVEQRTDQRHRSRHFQGEGEAEDLA